MSVVKNAILIRYDEGHIDVDLSTPGGNRIETYLQLANVRTREGADGLGRQQLALLRSDLRTVAFQGKIRQADQALGIGFRIGDTFDDRMIASVHVDTDVNGVLTARPEVEDPIQIREAALERRLQLIAAGITSEYANPNTDKQPEGSGTDTTPPEFSLSGPVTLSYSPIWTAPRPYQWSWLELTLGTPGSTSTVVRVLRSNGGSTTILGSATIAAGDRRSVSVINAGIPVGTDVLLAVASVGTGAEDLTAAPRGTMV